MVNRLYSVLIILLTLCFGSILRANASAKKYFPSTLGSYWVYVDQDGNELTRTAVEGEEIAGETYHAFNYQPTFEKWEKYTYHLHPMLFKVNDIGIKFFMDDGVKKAYKERLKKELEFSVQQDGGPPGFRPKYEIKVEVVTQDYFYLLRTPSPPNEEWDTMWIKPTVKVIMTPNSEVDAELAGMSMGTTFYFTILETGMITAKETVETPAGIFNDCLKIEYRTETVMPSIPGEGVSSGAEAGETVSRLWLAPNVGIVKFHQEYETPLLGAFGNSETTTQVKTVELKKYEIKSDASEVE